MAMREILVGEIAEVSGGIGPWGAAGGALASGVAYWGGSSNPTGAGLAVAMGTGAVGGFFGGFLGGGFSVVGGLYANETQSWY